MDRKGQNGERKIVDVESDNGDFMNNGQSDWRQDLPSIVLLLILYTLQGIPMGLSGSIPFLLLEKVDNTGTETDVGTRILHSTALLCSPPKGGETVTPIAFGAR